MTLDKVPDRRLWMIFDPLHRTAGPDREDGLLQLVQTDALETRARQLQTQKSQPLGQRRPIVDRNGRLVALDEKRFRLGPIPAISISRVMSQRRSAPQEMSPSAWPSPWLLPRQRC